MNSDNNTIERTVGLFIDELIDNISNDFNTDNQNIVENIGNNIIPERNEEQNVGQNVEQNIAHHSYNTDNESKAILNEIKSVQDRDTENIDCPHYKRGCTIYCDKCKKFYPCRLCHDEIMIYHSFDRFGASRMKCKKCSTEQNMGQKCQVCDNIMGKYYCNICHLFESNFEDDLENCDIRHCHKCGICRKGLNSHHCDNCGICVNNNHTCNNNTCNKYNLKDNCTVCMENMFYSTKGVHLSKCGHCLHTDCLKGLLQNRIYQCPLCKKSLIDMTNNWNRIEAYMSSTQMPEQYRDQTSNILCNDCEKKNTVPFHFMYHKCLDCNSWNTTVL